MHLVGDDDKPKYNETSDEVTIRTRNNNECILFIFSLFLSYFLKSELLYCVPSSFVHKNIIDCGRLIFIPVEKIFFSLLTGQIPVSG